MKFFSTSDQAKSERHKKKLLNLGVIDKTQEQKSQVCRSEKIALLDKYYENCQYDNLKPWTSKDTELHKKKPKIIFPFAKNLSSRVAAKIVGASVFPELSIKDDEMSNEFLKAVIRESKLRGSLMEPMKKLLNSGSIFIKFKIDNGVIKIESYDSKYCYPEFDSTGQLERVVYKYIYDDPKETKADGTPVRRWKKLEFNREAEILFDNPEYDPYSDDEPQFEEVERVDHNLGFVQGEWFSTVKDSTDGYGLCEDILQFIDELCYSISQSSRSVAYNQDPQLTFKGMDEDFISNLIRSVTKSWNLGREGEAKYLESGMGGVQEAGNLRDKVKGHVADMARVALLDPEKMVGSAQSARAMEVLQGPFVDLVDEIRTIIEDHIKALVLKISAACLIAPRMGMPAPFEMPAGYVPASMNIELTWPPIFKLTLEDMQKKIGLAVSASTANIISRKTATNYVKDIFGIIDIEAEAAEIAAQPVFNPFGGF